jgi:hypothetical protein
MQAYVQTSMTSWKAEITRYNRFNFVKLIRHLLSPAASFSAADRLLISSWQGKNAYRSLRPIVWQSDIGQRIKMQE